MALILFGKLLGKFPNRYLHLSSPPSPISTKKVWDNLRIFKISLILCGAIIGAFNFFLLKKVSLSSFNKNGAFWKIGLFFKKL